jgi:hypothetical protein
LNPTASSNKYSTVNNTVLSNPSVNPITDSISNSNYSAYISSLQFSSTTKNQYTSKTISTNPYIFPSKNADSSSGKPVTNVIDAPK